MMPRKSAPLEGARHHGSVHVSRCQITLLVVLCSLAFLNDTPVVALLVPVVAEWCRRHQLSVSKLMLPFSYVCFRLKVYGNTPPNLW
tara:strand:+ start:25055 stop:25315 length:261 start_codon:yes stop_codon:yes gene_type:complete